MWRQIPAEQRSAFLTWLEKRDTTEATPTRWMPEAVQALLLHGSCRYGDRPEFFAAAAQGDALGAMMVVVRAANWDADCCAVRQAAFDRDAELGQRVGRQLGGWLYEVYGAKC